MASGIEVNGIGKFDAGIQAQKRKVDAATEKFVRQGGEVIAGNARKQFIGGKEAQATDAWRSDAWPVPTRRTGNLQRSIRVTYVGRQGSSWVSQTGPTVKYGRRVELGYTGTGHFPYYTTRPFPFLQPGLEQSHDQLTRLYADLVTAAQTI
jgi:hypothetical protein